MYDVPVLQHVMKWKDQVLLRWIALLLSDKASDTLAESGAAVVDDRGGGHGSSSSTGKATPSASNGHAAGGSGTHGADNVAYGWEQRLGLAVHEAFCSARIAELFDIIADYPDSAVAIGELKVCGVCGVLLLSVVLLASTTVLRDMLEGLGAG